jgi:hypothetical protein
MAVDQLTPQDQEEMLTLLNQHFSGVDPAQFISDLREKDQVLLLRDKDSCCLKGFSTLLFYQTCFKGQGIPIVFSGDTIVDPSAWSSPVLAQAWIEAVRSVHASLAGQKLYWFLISSGFRTYRFLSVFCKVFFPHYQHPTPPEAQELMHHLAHERYGHNYYPELGIVRLPHPQPLRDHLAGIPEGRRGDPHIHFFEQVNAGHNQGDELVCLAEFSEANLTRAGQRIWSRGSTGELKPQVQRLTLQHSR